MRIRPAHPRDDTPTGLAPAALSDGGFEDPVIAPTSYEILPSANVPGCESTDPSGIEIWSTGFLGVPASVGNQFAEINAIQPGTLYQDVVTKPGQSFQSSLLHRGRSGTGVVDVVPAGQASTRFGCRADSTANGNPSVGNFLDDITFGHGPRGDTTADVAIVAGRRMVPAPR